MGDNLPARHATRQRTHSVQDILNVLLTVERLLMTFYYTGLTSPGVMRSMTLSGASADPNNPGLPPGGNPHHVRYLQAALDAEAKHTAALVGAGAASPHTRFIFPSRTFRSLGTSPDHGSFLGIMEILETLGEGAYLAAGREFLRQRLPDLALVAAEIMGVESEHRMLGRVLSRISPPTPAALVSDLFATIDDCGSWLHPFVTGTGYLFATDATRFTKVPSGAQVARIVGNYGTRRVRRFLWT